MKKILKNFWLKMALTGLCTVVIMFGLTSGSVLAQDDKANQDDKAGYEEYKKKQADKKLPPHERPAPHDPTGGAKHRNLAEAATNPIANMMQFQIQDVWSPSNWNSSGYSNSIVIQPVIPIPLSSKKVPILITRTTLPYVWTPSLEDPIGRVNGFGDLVSLGLFTPKLKTKTAQVGLGWSLTIPTAGDNQFTGSGKWSLGPSFLYINLATKGLQWGLFTYHEWSFASADGMSDRPRVCSTSLQPFITYHFGKGWYVGSPDTPQVYNWVNEEWKWAIGAQLGKVIKLGKIPAKVFVEPLYDPNNDNGPTAQWTIKFNVTLLFPE